MAEFAIHDIVPGIAFISGGVCNRGIISDGGDVLLIDSGISVAEAEPLRVAANERRQDGNLMLFNTHPHMDHVFGNQVFRDATIIAHQGVRDTLVNNGEQILANLRNNPMAALIGDITITLPTVTFQDKLTIYVGKIEVQLLYFGIAHSPSDSVAWLPESRTLFTGDLLFNAVVPVAPPGGNIANWIKVLEQLEQLGAEHVVSGHGPSEPPTALGKLRTWFETLRTHVAAAIESGLDRDATIARIIPEMQSTAPRANEEHMPMSIGLTFDELSANH
jgi:cyclase